MAPRGVTSLTSRSLPGPWSLLCQLPATPFAPALWAPPSSANLRSGWYLALTHSLCSTLPRPPHSNCHIPSLPSASPFAASQPRSPDSFLVLHPTVWILLLPSHLLSLRSQVPPASTTFHVLPTASAQPAGPSLLSSQPTCPIAAGGTLLSGDPQATFPLLLFVPLVTDPASRPTRGYPALHPPFHLTSYRASEFWLLKSLQPKPPPAFLRPQPAPLWPG